MRRHPRNIKNSMTVAKSTAGGYQRVTSSGLNTSGEIASAITEGTVTPRRRMITIVMAETSATPTNPGANVLAPNVPIAAPTVGAITPRAKWRESRPGW